MNILFDQGTPVPLRRFLANHKVETAYERGWSDLQNGELLAQAEVEGFELLVTTDQNLHYQQNLTNRSISIVVLMTTSWPRIKTQVEVIKPIIDSVQPGSYIEIPIP